VSSVRHSNRHESTGDCSKQSNVKSITSVVPTRSRSRWSDGLRPGVTAQCLYRHGATFVPLRIAVTSSEWRAVAENTRLFFNTSVHAAPVVRSDAIIFYSLHRMVGSLGFWGLAATTKDRVLAVSACYEQ